MRCWKRTRLRPMPAINGLRNGTSTARTRNAFKTAELLDMERVRFGSRQKPAGHRAGSRPLCPEAVDPRRLKVLGASI